ncbi:hypothetical protein SAMN04488107_2141 [Geodermatophilus saharensis]|uniref:DUF5642 domain-containing protein n=1 Tax=Geodermatophilus saharensis TaxID=1137994 RepID=A0A239DFU2_9ACTN|nr:hypothetical protein [Geodermatophilus saharensis]SNS30892.1 hypothetical protein SAMN04488107_2141 [Geodermatophilus saharensis]
MAATTRRRVRTTGAALAAAALLTAGCAGSDELAPAAATDESSAPTPSPTPRSSAPGTSTPGTSAPGTSAPGTSAPGASGTPSATPAPPPEEGASGELGDRLLPASAFGEDATVVGVTLDQLGAGSGWGGWGGWGGWPGPWYDGDHDGDGDDDWAGEVTVEPAGCQAALEALPALGDQLDDLAVASQAARTPQTQTVQVLAESPQLEGLQLPVDALLAQCSSVTTTGPWGGSTTLQLTRLDVPQLGDRSAGVQLTVAAAGEESHSVLVGFVVDGARGLLLAQSAAPDAAEPDPAAFTALLGEAAEAAAG